MPRPVADDPRDCFKTFRFTARELTRIEARARANGQTVSTYARAAILGRGDPEAAATAPRASSTTPPRAGAAARMLTDQIRRIGTNLNQIAHRMNELRIPPPRELTMLLDDIRALVRKAREP